MSANESRALLATCVAGAVAASRIIQRYSAGVSGIAWEVKAPADFVSRVDREAEEAIIDAVASRHADAIVIGEELSPATPLGSALAFIVDPLDGTTNFLHGFPHYAVSIAAVVGGTIQAAAVLNVPTGELFTATAGGGARRNGETIRVSALEQPDRALIGTGIPFRHRELIDPYLRQLPAIMRGAAGIRRAGSAALDLADVACGRFDAFWELRLAPWDIAGGILLVREAGGIITDLDGSPIPLATTSVVAGNPAMHRWLLETVAASGSEDTISRPPLNS